MATRARAFLLGLLAVHGGEQSLLSAQQPPFVIPPNFPESERSIGDVYPALKSDVLKVNFMAGTGGHVVRVRRLEREDNNSEWIKSEDAYSVSYTIMCLATRNGGNDLFVAGLTDDGTAIIERWRFGAEEGRWMAAPRFTPPEEPSPPAGNPDSIVLSAGAIAWRSPDGGEIEIPWPRKQVVYSGDLGPVSVMAADPDGRFLLLYALETRELYSLGLGGEGTELHYLAGGFDLGGLSIRTFEGKPGRFFFGTKLNAPTFNVDDQVYTLMHDDDNDGEIGGTDIETYTRAQMMQSPYGNWEDWCVFWIVN